jgi:hypothetical protein
LSLQLAGQNTACSAPKKNAQEELRCGVQASQNFLLEVLLQPPRRSTAPQRKQQPFTSFINSS